MLVQTEAKFSLGDKVIKYITKTTPVKKVICPLCDGKHIVDHPDEDSVYGEVTCPICDKDGYVVAENKKERAPDGEIYIVDSITVQFNKNGAKISYFITSTPELNNRTSGYISTSVNEEDLALYEG